MPKKGFFFLFKPPIKGEASGRIGALLLAAPAPPEVPLADLEPGFVGCFAETLAIVAWPTPRFTS